MECNKDEAMRAKRIAENRMRSGDFVGALKFATKAKQMFPEVENIAQILTVCEVHCAAAQNKVSGSDMDWYGILLTERLADQVTIKKQYRKLALLLHPDKNKSAGAEAAFKLVEQANRFLSGQTKCSAGDLRITGPVGATLPKVQFHDPSRKPLQQYERQTFWTYCLHCKTRYQYYKTTMNAILRCQQCSKFFKAHDMGNQGAPPGYTYPSSNNRKEPPKHVPSKEASKNKEPPKDVPPKEASKSNGGKPCGRGPMDKFVQSSPVSMSKRTAGVGVSHKVEKSKGGHATAGLKRTSVGTSNPCTSKAKEIQTSKNVGSKRARRSVSDLRDDRKAENVNDMKDTNVQENSVDPSGLDAGVHRRKSSRKKHVSYTETAEGGDSQSSSKRSRQHESFNITEVGRRDVPAIGGLFNNSSPASFTAGVTGQNVEMRNKVSAQLEESVLENKMKIEQSNLQRKEASKSGVDDRKPKCSPLNSNLPPSSGIWCPDPDFSDFEKDRTEDCFAANQFWAIFDDIDCMPRFYALVRKVYSPFKLKITWLEVDSDDQGEIDWHDAGLPVACGKYKLGQSLKTTDLAIFSHQIHCIKRSDMGSYLVYPKKGETWAIFRDWDIGWSSNPEKHFEYQFEYVEVLSDFDENIGIGVSYLDKVKGFVSLFHKTVRNGFRILCIQPSKLYRFSHRIPSYRMTGNEREGVPIGSFELDPAGLPISEVGDSGDAKMEDGVLNNGVNASSHKSSMSEAEQAMSNEGTHKAKLREGNASGRVSPILIRSPRSNVKSMNNGQASTSQYMSKCTVGVCVSHKVEKAKGGHAPAGLTKASVGTSNPCTSKAKESQTLKNVGSERARQSASDFRDDRKAEHVNNMKGTNVQENGVDTSGLDAGVHHRKSSRKKQHVPCTETAVDGDSHCYSKRSRQHESSNTTEVGNKELPASGGLFNNNSPASFTAGVAGQKVEKRQKESAPPEESVLKNKMKNEKSNLQRKAASKSDRDDRKPKANNCSPFDSNLPPNSGIWCPDPDFSDFEKDRTEDRFAASQFWAAFDDIDAMPRLYALVRKVYSPFKLQITWLHVDSDDQGEIDWHYADLPVACGKFKLGRSEIVTDRFLFSHQIHCIKGSNWGSYLVYPKKGETWAIFRDWDIGWSSNPRKHSKYEYEYVEVLSDFDENFGIGVSYLGKVNGFVSLFQQTVQNGFRSFCIPPNELYRFAHHIPSYKMAGDEREGVPRGSFELNTLCLPLNLFEVGDPGDANIEDGVAMTNEGTHKAKKITKEYKRRKNTGQASTGQRG